MELLTNAKTAVLTVLIVGIGIAITGIVTTALSNAATRPASMDNNMTERTFNGTAALVGGVALQLPTVGTIIGVALIVGVVFGGILYVLHKRNSD